MIEGIENFFRQLGGVCIPYYDIRENGIIGEVIHSMRPKVKSLIGYKV